MTILAGMVSRTRGAPIPERARNSMRRLISRDHRDAVAESMGDGWYLAKVDIGVLGAPAMRIDAGRDVSMLAGEPLLVTGGDDSTRNRTEDLDLLHRAFQDSDRSVLAKATGVFCGAYYDQVGRVLTLYTDKLGLRPVYYWLGTEFVVFATALRILENLTEVPKRLDRRGVSEIAAFGFPLAERTAYEGISTLRAGEVISIADQEIEKHEYWRWDRLPAHDATGLSEGSTIHRRFISAVRRRIGAERVTASFLSGGLDSRSIVSALRSLEVNVQSINWAPPRTQDKVFAEMVSSALETTHHQLTKETDDISDRSQVYNQAAVTKWFESLCSASPTPPRRNVIWSGDGGSVAVGHVYLNAEIVQLAQSGREDEAIDAFLRHNSIGLAAGLFQSGVADEITSIPRRGIADELSRLQCRDRGRAIHLFLMLNDQRRHLADSFENIDLGRLELQLPFYDSDFLEPILSSPVNDFLGHRFYVEWLKNFSPVTVSVPWQAYRGHVPCPLPTPEDLRYQWTDYYDQATARQMMQTLVKRASSMLKAGRLPESIVSAGRLRFALWLTRLGVRDFTYAIKQASVYGKFWMNCDAAPGQDRATSGKFS